MSRSNSRYPFAEYYFPPLFKNFIEVTMLTTFLAEFAKNAAFVKILTS